MTHLDFIAALVNQLDDMVAKLRFDNFRDLLGICQAESHIGKGWVEHTTSGIIQLTTATGSPWVF